MRIETVTVSVHRSSNCQRLNLLFIFCHHRSVCQRYACFNCSTCEEWNTISELYTNASCVNCTCCNFEKDVRQSNPFYVEVLCVNGPAGYTKWKWYSCSEDANVIMCMCSTKLSSCLQTLRKFISDMFLESTGLQSESQIAWLVSNSESRCQTPVLQLYYYTTSECSFQSVKTVCDGYRGDGGILWNRLLFRFSRRRLKMSQIRLLNLMSRYRII